MEKRIIRTGGSSAFVISSAVRQISGIEAGDVVDVKCSKGKIVLTKKKEQ